MVKLFAGKVRISVFVPLLCVVAMFSSDAVFLYIILCCAAFHEFGHLLAMRLLGAEFRYISIYPFGVDIRTDTSHLSYGQEAVVALAGPFASVALALVSAGLYFFLPGIYSGAVTVTNLLFFAVNIFPVRGLDGGRILLSLLFMRFEFSKAYRIYLFVSTGAFAVLCMAALIILFLTGYNLSLAFMCVYLFLSEYSRQKLLGE